MSCKYVMDVFCTHVCDVVIDQSMYEMLVLELTCQTFRCAHGSPVNKSIKTKKFKEPCGCYSLNIHGSNATVHPRAGRYNNPSFF